MTRTLLTLTPLMRRLTAWLCATATASASWAVCGRDLTRPDGRYAAVAGANGDQVLDKGTGLIWQRCAVGKTWDKATERCTGTLRSVGWQVAMTLGRQVPSTSGTGWRLPSYVELLTLVDMSCTNPAVNAKWFADRDIRFLWSSSPYEKLADYAWGLQYTRGEITFDSKIEEFQVRLVRAP